jgi:hypothetical protein
MRLTSNDVYLNRATVASAWIIERFTRNHTHAEHRSLFKNRRLFRRRARQFLSPELTEGKIRRARDIFASCIFPGRIAFPTRLRYWRGVKPNWTWTSCSNCSAFPFHIAAQRLVNSTSRFTSPLGKWGEVFPLSHHANVTGSIPNRLAIAFWVIPKTFRAARSFSARVLEAGKGL